MIGWLGLVVVETAALLARRQTLSGVKPMKFTADLRVIFVLRGNIVYTLDIGSHALYRT